MTISLESLYAPLPTTNRAQTTHLTYDARSNRIAYPSGKTIVIRSLSNLSHSLQFLSHNMNTTVAKFAPSGYYIASADETGNVKIWDSTDKTTIGGGSVSKKELYEEPIIKSEFQVLSGKINDLSWDSESKRIIAVGNGKEKYGHCFTFDSGNSVGEISGHSAQINAVSIRPVRPFRAITGSDDGGLVWFQGPPFKFQYSIRGHHSNFIKDVKFSPNGEHVVSVGSDKKITVYEGKTGEFVKEIPNDHTGSIFAISWFEDSSKFVTCSSDCSIKVWDVASGENVGTHKFETNVENQQLGVIVTNDYVVSLSLNGNLNLLDKNNLKPIEILTGHQKNITSLVLNKGVLFTGSYDGKIFQWDLEAGLPKSVKGSPHENNVVALISEDAETKSVGWDDYLLTIKGGEFVEDLKLKLPHQPKSISRYSHGFAILYENLVEIYDKSQKKIQELKLSYNATASAICDDYIIIGATNSIYKYNLKLEPVGSPIQSRSTPSYVSLSADNSKIAVGDATGKIILYDSETLQIITSRWSFHTSRITSISWLDSSYIVSGSLDTNIYIYSVARASKNIKVLGAHKDGVSAATWNGDKEIITGGNDGTIKKWAVDLSPIA